MVFSNPQNPTKSTGCFLKKKKKKLWRSNIIQDKIVRGKGFSRDKGSKTNREYDIFSVEDTMAPSLHSGMRSCTVVTNPRLKTKTGNLGHSPGTEENG